MKMNLMQRIVAYFVIWIFFQLMLLGAATGNIAYDIENNIYDCSPAGGNRFSYTLIGMTVPLIMVIPHPDTKDYCRTKEPEKKVDE